MIKKTSERHVPPAIFLAAFVLSVVLYLVWKAEPQIWEELPLTTFLAWYIIYPLMFVFGFAVLFYILELTGTIHVKRNRQWTVAVIAFIVVFWGFFGGIAIYATYPSMKRGVAADLSNESVIIQWAEFMYYYHFKDIFGYTIAELFGFGLFWSIGKRRL